MDRETEAIMASKKPTARKTTKSTLKQKLVAMEKALEKGAADLGRRVKKEMPAVKARVAKAGKRVSQTAVAVEEELKNDPSERKNLASSSPEKAQELLKKLKAWRADVDAQMMTPNPKYDPTKAKGKKGGRKKRKKK